MSRVLFSSASEHWATPTDLYAALDAEFRFTLDPCPLGGASVEYPSDQLRRVALPDFTNGLVASWRGERVYCNPPYGREVRLWLEKAREAELAVYLLPARTDTKWWHDYAMRADEIRFLRGRLKFGGSKTGAPFPSVVLVYRNAP